MSKIETSNHYNPRCSCPSCNAYRNEMISRFLPKPTQSQRMVWKQLTFEFYDTILKS